MKNLHLIIVAIFIFTGCGAKIGKSLNEGELLKSFTTQELSENKQSNAKRALIKQEGPEHKVKKTSVSLAYKKNIVRLLSEIGEIENRYYIFKGKEFDIGGIRNLKATNFESLNKIVKAMTDKELVITKNSFDKTLPKTVEVREQFKAKILDEVKIEQGGSLVPSKLFSSLYAETGWSIEDKHDVKKLFNDISYVDFRGSIREFVEYFASSNDLYVDYRYKNKMIRFSKLKQKTLRLKATSEIYSFTNSIEVNLNDSKGQDKESKSGVKLSSTYDIYPSILKVLQAVIPNSSSESDETSKSETSKSTQTTEDSGEASNKDEEYVKILTETGHVIVNASRSHMEKIEDIIYAINTDSFKQVYIKATLIETDLSKKFNNGINWGYVKTKLDAEGAVKSVLGAALNSASSGASLDSAMTSGTFIKYRSNKTGINTVLKLLNEFGDTSVSYQAPVTTTNNIPAIYNISSLKGFISEFKISTDSDGNTQLAPSQETVTGGSYLYVKPTIYEDDILLSIKMVTSRINPFTKHEFSDGQYVQSKDIDKKLFSQNVVLKSGDKIIIGGIIQKNYSQTYSGAANDSTSKLAPLLGEKTREMGTNELALMLEVVEL